MRHYYCKHIGELSNHIREHMLIGYHNCTKALPQLNRSMEQ